MTQQTSHNGNMHAGARKRGTFLVTTASALLAGALTLGAAPSTALAKDAVIQTIDHSLGTNITSNVVNVYSSDGTEWDTLSGPPLKFTAIFDIDTQWPGYIKSWALFLGACNEVSCTNNPNLHANLNYVARSLFDSMLIEIPMAWIPVSNEGIATIPLGDEILEACNDLSISPTQNHSFTRYMPTTLVANTDTYAGVIYNNYLPNVAVQTPQDYGTGDVSHTTNTVIEVHCNAYEEDLGDVPNDGLQIQDLEMFLSTFSNAFSYPEPDIECQKGRILLRVTTNEAGPVELRLWTQTDGPEEFEYIQTWSSHVGSGLYQAEIIRWVEVDESVELQAMAETVNGSAGWSTGWDFLTLHCFPDSGDWKPGGRGDDDDDGFDYQPTQPDGDDDRNPGNKTS